MLTRSYHTKYDVYVRICDAIVMVSKLRSRRKEKIIATLREALKCLSTID